MAIRKTSVQTYNFIKREGILSQKRMRVYDIFYEHPDGLTGSQVSYIYKSRFPTSQFSETIRNRITELRDMGVLTEAGEVECEFTFRSVIKFVLNDNLPSTLQKKPTLNTSANKICAMISAIEGDTTDQDTKQRLRDVYEAVDALKKRNSK